MLFRREGLEFAEVRNQLHFHPLNSRNMDTQTQLRRLREMLAPVLGTNAFYRQKLTEAGVTHPNDVQSLPDYRQLPFTTKEELSTDQVSHPPYGTNLTFPLERYTCLHRTSGTTGSPLRWLDTAESWDWWGKCWGEIYRAAGVTAADRLMIAFSFGPFIGFWSAYHGAQQLGALTIPNGGMTSDQRIRAILSNDVTVLIATPTYTRCGLLKSLNKTASIYLKKLQFG